MRMFVIEDRKKEKLSKGIEKMLQIGGKLMSCIENLEESEDESGYGERDYDDYDEYEDDDMGMRGGMGRRSYGRYGMRRMR